MFIVAMSVVIVILVRMLVMVVPVALLMRLRMLIALAFLDAFGSGIVMSNITMVFVCVMVVSSVITLFFCDDVSTEGEETAKQEHNAPWYSNESIVHGTLLDPFE